MFPAAEVIGVDDAGKTVAHAREHFGSARLR
jgi:hypothetical protein